MFKTKPCRCGCTNIDVLYDNCGPLWVCLVGCMNINCCNEVIRFGMTKEYAEWRAVKAWNRRAERG